MSAVNPSPSRLRRMLPWAPAVLLLVAQLIAWGTMFSGGMAGVVGWLMLLSAVPLVGVVSLLVAGIYAVWKRRFSPPIAATALMSLIALWPGAWNLGLGQIAYPASLESTQPSATVRLPSNEPLRVAWGGDRLATNRHAFTPDQRWAYDIVIEPYFNQSSKLEDYGCWGTPVVAPTRATVHAAHDGEPDAEPGKASNNSAKPLGNFVALELETQTYLIIAHLQPGSVSVQVGDTVNEGQPIGRCGNSGNTSEPHIHIHHQRQSPLTHPTNFAEGLPLFFRDHDGPPMPEGGVGVDAGRLVARGALVRHVGASASNSSNDGSSTPH